MNKAQEQQAQQQEQKELRQLDKARRARAKRREKRSFKAQQRAMERKGIPEDQWCFVMNKHWDPSQLDPANPDPQLIQYK